MWIINQFSSIINLRNFSDCFRENAGTEALFADVGHFTVRSIQISMCAVTYPALVLAYTGQASFLRKHHQDVADLFFKSIPREHSGFRVCFLSS